MIVGRLASQMAVMSGVSIRVTPSSVTIFSPGLARRTTTAEGGVPAGRSRASSDRGKLDRAAQHRGQLAGDPLVAQQVGAVRGDVDDDLMIGNGHDVQEPAPRRRGGVELENAHVVFAKT